MKLQLLIIYLLNTTNMQTDWQKVFPDSIGLYKKSAELEINNIKTGAMEYFSALQLYSYGESKLAITVIDYQSAAVMFQNSMKQWENKVGYEDEKYKSGGVSAHGMSGWGTWNKDNSEASLMMALDGRFIINIQIINSTGDKQALTILEALKLETLKK